MYCRDLVEKCIYNFTSLGSVFLLWPEDEEAECKYNRSLASWQVKCVCLYFWSISKHSEIFPQCLICLPRHNQDGRGKEIVYRTSVNPWNVLFRGQSNLQCSQIRDVASSTSRGLCSVPGAHTDSSVAAAWIEQLELSEVLEKQHMAPVGELLLARPPNSLKYQSPKLSVRKLSMPCCIPCFSLEQHPQFWHPFLTAFCLVKSISLFLNLIIDSPASSRKQIPWCDWIPGSALAMQEEIMVMPPPYSRPVPPGFPHDSHG